MSARLFKCVRCGYHYPAKRVARYVHVGGQNLDAPDRYICLDSGRCQGNIDRRESDRRAAAKS